MTTSARTSPPLQADRPAPDAQAVEPLRLVHPAAELVFLTARCPWLWRFLIEMPRSSADSTPRRPWLGPEGLTDQLLLTIGQRRDWHLHVLAGPSPAGGRTPDTTPRPLAREPEIFASVEIAAAAEGRQAWASLAQFASPAGCPLDLAVAYGLGHEPVRLAVESTSGNGGSCRLHALRGEFACRVMPRASTPDEQAAFGGLRLTWSESVPRVFDLFLSVGDVVGLEVTIEQAELIHRLTGATGRPRVIAAQGCADAELHYTRPRCSFVEAARYV